MDSNIKRNEVGFPLQILLCLIKLLLFVYDFVTFPFYMLYQRPWIVSKAAKRNKSFVIDQTENSKTFQRVKSNGLSQGKLLPENVQTMDQCFDFMVQQYCHKRMAGTRELLGKEEEKQFDGTICWKWNMGVYKWKTYLQVNEMATNFGRGMRELGLKPMEKVCLFSETNEEWMISALGCFKQNFPIVTLYANLGEDAIIFGLHQTEVTHIITSHTLLPKLKNILCKVPNVKNIIFIDDPIDSTDCTGFECGVSITSFFEVINLGINSKMIAVAPKKDDPSIIMYTSGSTGVPKGVVLSHEAMIATVNSFRYVVEKPTEEDIYLGYLPLAHIYELLTEMTMLSQGIPIGYSSPNTMIDTSPKLMKGIKGDCTILKPTLMCAVPLVLEKIYKRIKQKIEIQGSFMEALLSYCFEYKSWYLKFGMKTPIMDAIVYKKMRSVLGGRVRILLSGGAPLSPDVHNYLRCVLCIELRQGYGLTESCACATLMHKDEILLGFVGPPHEGVLIKLTDWEEGNYRVTDNPCPRGEIVLGGKCLATEYFKLPEKTEEEFYTDESGRKWFRTGDIGEMSSDGTMRIIDRKKDIVKLSCGEYLSLGKVESELKTSQFVESICLYGDPIKSNPVALIVPSEEKLKELAQKLGMTRTDFEDLCKDDIITSTILKELYQQGKRSGLKHWELPNAITLVKEDWNPESGLVTSAFKIKRRPIQDFYQKEIDRMCGK